MVEEGLLESKYKERPNKMDRETIKMLIQHYYISEYYRYIVEKC